MSASHTLGSILVVDDEEPIRQMMTAILNQNGYQAESVASVAAACNALSGKQWDMVFTDLRMPEENGLDVLHYIKEKDLDTLAVVVTGFACLDSATQALRARAYDYITKPYRAEDILRITEEGIRQKAARSGKAAATRKRTRKAKGKRRKKELIGKSPCMQELKALIERVAPSASTVLIHGESGTGKELVARALHDNSPRKDGPFVPVNCGAIPEDLLESELFGHVHGAFTGAVANRAGRFVLADGGTILLDEIGDMSPKLQVKVLRVLQEQELEPVGSTETIRVDTRVIAATNINLERAVAERRFREDLFYRLNVIPIQVPPLRQRDGDLPLLVNHFLKIFRDLNGDHIHAFAGRALEALSRFPWPGNVRQLENLVERMTVLADGPEVDVKDLPEQFLLPEVSRGAQGASLHMPPPPDNSPAPPASGSPGGLAFGDGPLAPSMQREHTRQVKGSEGVTGDERDWLRVDMPDAPPSEAAPEESSESPFQVEIDHEGIDLSSMVDDLEKQMILQALEKCNGVKSRAAEMLRIKRTTLVEKMKKKNITWTKPSKP